MLELAEFLQLHAMFAIPVVTIGVPSYLLLGRGVRGHAWDGLQLVMPGGLWLLLVVLADGDKSLSNLLELPLLGVVTGMLFSLRVALSRRLPSRSNTWSFIALLGSSAMAIVLWACIPRLPM
ncbi:hypothetical protein [Pseudoxanthomonas mexicana]|uniref:hypothetical protein n=1 Tax=Pseudoxanthomonas mexicana TaxID=128785 RepID=UPI00078045E5|nr:hypothetical protein [Pseudoxanthomonas mexicana]